MLCVSYHYKKNCEYGGYILVGKDKDKDPEVNHAWFTSKEQQGNLCGRQEWGWGVWTFCK